MSSQSGRYAGWQSRKLTSPRAATPLPRQGSR